MFATASPTRSNTLPGISHKPRLARERSEPLGQLAGDVDREVVRRRAVVVDQTRQRHQVELGHDDELQPLEGRAQRADVPLELVERRGLIAGNSRRLQRGYEERPARHGVDAIRG